MDGWVQRNSQALSLLVGLAFVVLGVVWNPWFLFPGVIFLILGLFGDRIVEFNSKLFGFKMIARRFRDQVERITETAPTEHAAHAQAGGSVTRETTESVSMKDSPTAEVTRGNVTTDAVLAAANEIEKAATPEELADRAVRYFRLRSVPGLRGLSRERIRGETELFGAILELQTMRANGDMPPDERRLAEILRDIEVFWTTPQQLGDEAVENTATAVRSLIQDMAR